jgi:hypothetical protein
MRSTLNVPTQCCICMAVLLHFTINYLWHKRELILHITSKLRYEYVKPLIQSFMKQMRTRCIVVPCTSHLPLRLASFLCLYICCVHAKEAEAK